MRCHRISPLLVLLALVGCGGDDEAGSTTPGSTATSSGAETRPLAFDHVEGFTLDYLKDEASLNRDCKVLGWAGEAEKRKLVSFPGTTVTEILTCEGIPYLFYLEYDDAAAATDGLAPALLPYLVAEETKVVMAGVSIDEAVAAAYLQALEAECGCGEVVWPER